MALWPEDVDQRVKETFEPPMTVTVDRRALALRSARMRAATAILFMLVGALVASVGIGVAAGWPWGLGVFGVSMFTVGVRIGDNS